VGDETREAGRDSSAHPGSRTPDGSPEGAREPGPRKRFVFWSITLLAPTALLLLGAEVALRIAHPDEVSISRSELTDRLRESQQQEVRVVTTGNLRGLIQPSGHPEIVYELKPSRHWVFQGAETTTNAHGLRGREYDLEKPPGTLRVAGLGDSVMFGWGVDQDAIYMSRLEKALSRPDRQVEVLNFAVPGYNSAQQAAVLEEKVLRFSPDLLLLNYCTNDWVAPFFVVDPNLGGIIESSLLLRNIRQRLVPGTDESFFATLRGQDTMRAALRRIGEVARRERLPVIFYLYPHPAGGGDLALAEGLARDDGFIYVDLRGPFEEYLRRQRLSEMAELNVRPDDPHPGPEAHGVIARALAEPIEDSLQPRKVTLPPAS